VAIERLPDRAADSYLRPRAVKSEIQRCLEAIRRLEAELEAATKLSKFNIVPRRRLPIPSRAP
jgi:hypothetical protein